MTRNGSLRPKSQRPTRLEDDSVVAGGDVVLLLAAGTGYTWAATVLEWRD